MLRCFALVGNDRQAKSAFVRFSCLIYRFMQSRVHPSYTFVHNLLQLHHSIAPSEPPLPAHR